MNFIDVGIVNESEEGIFISNLQNSKAKLTLNQRNFSKSSYYILFALNLDKENSTNYLLINFFHSFLNTEA